MLCCRCCLFVHKAHAQTGPRWVCPCPPRAARGHLTAFVLCGQLLQVAMQRRSCDADGTCSSWMLLLTANATSSGRLPPEVDHIVWLGCQSTWTAPGICFGRPGHPSSLFTFTSCSCSSCGTSICQLIRRITGRSFACASRSRSSPQLPQARAEHVGTR